MHYSAARLLPVVVAYDFIMERIYQRSRVTRNNNNCDCDCCCDCCCDAAVTVTAAETALTAVLINSHVLTLLLPLMMICASIHQIYIHMHHFVLMPEFAHSFLGSCLEYGHSCWGGKFAAPGSPTAPSTYPILTLLSPSQLMASARAAGRASMPAQLEPLQPNR